MKKTLSLILCIMTVCCLSACKKDTAEKKERRLTQQLLSTDTLSGTVTGTLKMKLDAMGEQAIDINGSFNTDTTTGYPKFRFDGTVSIGGIMSLPLSYYTDENSWSASIMGTTQGHAVDDNRRNQIKNGYEQLSANQANIPRTVKEAERNGQKALEIHYDISQINSLLSTFGNAGTSFEQLTLYYLLNDNDELSQVDADIICTSGQRYELYLSIPITQTGQPVNIAPL